ncbi:hypothetical protein Q5N51_17380 [Vibrio cholerae]|nr:MULTISPECIES: hypothetical protein [Vibrio]MDV2398071.1 hypothetical protein [Vibrio cholerae]
MADHFTAFGVGRVFE